MLDDRVASHYVNVPKVTQLVICWHTNKDVQTFLDQILYEHMISFPWNILIDYQMTYG